VSAFWPVDVQYDVRRTVYVQAPDEAAAQRLALDPKNWTDAEQPDELMDTLRLAEGSA
jgi:hypothetical protein